MPLFESWLVGQKKTHTRELKMQVIGHVDMKKNFAK